MTHRRRRRRSRPSSACATSRRRWPKPGSGFADVVRVTYVLPDAAEFAACWPVLRKYFGTVRPAAMMISAGLADPRMKIEIEVTARKRAG